MKNIQLFSNQASGNEESSWMLTHHYEIDNSLHSINVFYKVKHLKQMRNLSIMTVFRLIQYKNKSNEPILTTRKILTKSIGQFQMAKNMLL